ncbi:hypothetical protein DNTS_003273 [Danionella cerebrum]|uniref:Fibrinogen C-terminal domain-containing protein n=1 Tax=Danionella cerebrum TaxID=2873325 RepID=A0A553MVI9_9TELE|nr:hypothetical protein DNTS_003273 [Danionella translucida]
MSVKQFLLALLTITLSRPDSPSLGFAEEFDLRDDALENEFMYAGRTKRSPDAQSTSDTSKCSYTFIIPQQKPTGAICVNSKSPETEPLEKPVQKQELELLNTELLKQRRQIESLQQLVEVDGGILNEVKLLRKESRNMNARVTQLYLQLLHEIIRKRDNALEVTQLENRVLNHTSEMHTLTARYRDLEHKYLHLASLANNQSSVITQLEEQCRRGGFGRQTRPPAIPPQEPMTPQHRQNPPPHPPSKPFYPPTYARNNNQMTNEIQNDQNVKPMVPPLPTEPSETHSFSTDKPSVGDLPFLAALVQIYEANYLLHTENDKYARARLSGLVVWSEAKEKFSRGVVWIPLRRVWPESRCNTMIWLQLSLAFISLTEKYTSRPFRDCLQALEEGHGSSGMFLLKPEDTNRLMQVWCEQRHDPGGWTLIQRRMDGSVNFFRNWETYKQGFGNMDGEYWLGLENIYWLTRQGNYKLLVKLEDWSGRKTFAEYASFRLEPEEDFYRLRVGRYHGNAGDSLTWHNGKQFTTLDRDHDAYTGNCAHYQKGGWWYNACAHSNLNGVWYRGGHYRSRYQDGVYWAEFRGGSYSLKKVTMMIRPNPNTFH